MGDLANALFQDKPGPAVVPIQDKEPSEIWRTLAASPRPMKTVDYPRNDETGKPIGKVTMWPLTTEEQHLANAAADNYVRKLLDNPKNAEERSLGYEHCFGNDCAIQILFRACRDPQDPIHAPAFPSTELMRRKLPADEIAALFRMYLIVVLELGPVIRAMSTAEIEALLSRIKEGGSAYPFGLLSLESQIALLLFSASKLGISSTDIGSPGSPLDEPETKPSSEPASRPEGAEAGELLPPGPGEGDRVELPHEPSPPDVPDEG